MQLPFQDVYKIRPPLRLISPVSFWSSCVFAVLNIGLGIILFFSLDQYRLATRLLIVNHIMTFQVWGLIFWALAAGFILFLSTNRWQGTRFVTLCAITVKWSWAGALIYRSVSLYGTWTLTILWVVIALLHSIIFIFFYPPLYKILRDTGERVPSV